MIRKMAESEDIGKALKLVVDKITSAVEQRPKALPAITPRLVAVSKTKPVSAIITAYQHGQRHFGENYVQELEEKARNVKGGWGTMQNKKILEQCEDIKWHFIGHLQRNKSGKVAVVPNLYMVETVDNQKLAQTLNNHWEKYKRPGKLRVMVQVNTSLEENKSGCALSDMCSLVKFIVEKCPSLQFVGLMTIGAIGYNDADSTNPDFLKLAECRQELCREFGFQLEKVELSMGMSSDFKHAIKLGSTNVRVGSTIFGKRDHGPKQHETKASPSSADNQSINTDAPSCASNSPLDTTEALCHQSQDSWEETLVGAADDPEKLTKFC